MFHCASDCPLTAYDLCGTRPHLFAHNSSDGLLASSGSALRASPAMPKERPQSVSKMLKVLHVTDTMASGVGRVVESIAANYKDAKHSLIYSTKRAGKAGIAHPEGFEEIIKMPDSHAERLRHLPSYVSAIAPDIVHAHSAYAGFYVRATLRHGHPYRIVYTPHCYAFLRTDVPLMVRNATRMAERALARNTDYVAACSPYEAYLAGELASGSVAGFVPNVASGSFSAATPELSTQLAPRAVDDVAWTDRLTICSSGRIAVQKDPGFFADVVTAARELGMDVHAVWIGDGDAELRERLLDAEVAVTGWLSPDEVSGMLGSSDVYVSTSLWEGFPLTLAEATSLGVPSVVRHRPVYDGLAIPTVAGGAREIARTLRVLQRDSEREKLLSEWREALAINDVQGQIDALHEAYGVVNA